AGPGQVLAVGGIADRVGVVVRRHFGFLLARAEVPEADVAVEAARGQFLAVGREGEGVDRPQVAVALEEQHEHLPPGEWSAHVTRPAASPSSGSTRTSPPPAARSSTTAPPPPRPSGRPPRTPPAPSPSRWRCRSA